MRFWVAVPTVIFALTAIPGEAQTVPRVSSVVRSADFAGRVPPNSFGSIYGSNLADATHVASEAWPLTLGGVKVYGCQSAVAAGKVIPAAECRSLPLIFVSAGQINFYVPSDIGNRPNLAVLGPSQLTMEPGSVPYLETILTEGRVIAPAIFRTGYDCFIDPRFQDAGKNCGLSWTAPAIYTADRGTVTDLNGSLITASNPARLGQYLVIWATGLGAFAAKNGAIVRMGNVPVYGFAGDTYYPIQTIYSGESSFSGLYQINTQIPLSLATGIPETKPGVGAYPPPWPCGNYKWEVSLSVSVANRYSNLVQVPVVVSSADIPGCK